jgi:hypothetical protein
MSQLKLIANKKKLEKFIIKVDKNKLTNSYWQCHAMKKFLMKSLREFSGL